MKMTDPIGQGIYGPLFIRLALGSYFIMAGLLKLEDLNAFVAEVQRFQMMPEEFATVFGIMLPYIEIVFGGLFLIGMWTTLAGLILGGLLCSFIYVFGLFQGDTYLFNKDAVLLSAVICVLYTGAGAFSIDRFRKQG